jgi:hypothetical protein
MRNYRHVRMIDRLLVYIDIDANASELSTANSEEPPKKRQRTQELQTEPDMCADDIVACSSGMSSTNTDVPNDEMQTTPQSEQWERDDKFYLNEGDCVVRVEKTLFKVSIHRTCAENLLLIVGRFTDSCSHATPLLSSACLVLVTKAPVCKALQKVVTINILWFYTMRLRTTFVSCSQYCTLCGYMDILHQLLLLNFCLDRQKLLTIMHPMLMSALFSLSPR